MSYTCPRCHATSHHPADAVNHYCGACHRFATDEARDGMSTWSGYADGEYAVYVSVGDRGWRLREDQARAHATAVMASCTVAEHVCAVLGLLHTDELTAEIARDLAARYAAGYSAHDTLDGTVRLVPQIARRRDDHSVYVPLVEIHCDGIVQGQVDTADLAGHAQHVLRTITAARLDTALHTVLTDTVELSPARAQALVSGVQGHWPGHPAHVGQSAPAQDGSPT